MTHIGSAVPRLGYAVAAITLVLGACGPGGPLPVTYVLSAAPAARENVEPLVGLPVLEVKPVLLPDYLDVSDIMVRRSGNIIEPSPTGHWAERLSVGATRALTSDLQQLLSGVLVTNTGPLEHPALQVIAELETFEPQTDGTVILVARWRLLNATSRSVLANERVSLIESSSGTTDPAMTAGMSRALADLSAHIAPAVRIALARNRGR
jgi:uncharacterized lipoprotein YmbA